MGKTETSKKHTRCFDDIPIVKSSKKIQTRPFDPEAKLRDKDFVAKAFFEALCDGDQEAALEILQGYIEAKKKTEIAKQENMPVSTVYQAFSKKGNPTIKTVARVMHSTK